MATPTATDAYRRRFGDRFGRTYFRRYDGLSVASIGIGTYLGDPTDAADDRYREALVTAIENGTNVVDTAINYRHQRSERVVGEALDEADVDRDAVFVATKGGFLPFDGDRPDDPAAYLRQTYLESGVLESDDLVRGMHSIAPDFLGDQLDRSRSNLGVETVDCYYVHNPETQLAEHSREVVYDRLEAAFRRLEERVADGHLRSYGVATWEAFRVPPGDDQYLSLPEVLSRAESAADAVDNDTTSFRAVQLPFNVVMADAFRTAAHGGVEGDGSVGDGSWVGGDGPQGEEGPQSALEFAHEAGLSVFTSASLAQGQLAEVGAIPEAVAERLPGDTPAQRAINFARSAPGVTCSLVGASSTEHVEENLGAGVFDAMGAAAFDATFE